MGKMSEQQAVFIDMLLAAHNIAVRHLKPGGNQRDLVRAVKQYFRKQGVERYDLYPPLHGCGVAEAEMPYPNENTTGVFEPGMTVNTDISLFGHPFGSNRIEEGFVITPSSCESMSRLVGQLSADWKQRRK